MPHPDEHAADCVRILGKPYREVHEWLDEFAHTPGLGGVAHRRKRHHLKGLLEARAKFGDEGRKAAFIHIMADLKQVGWTRAIPLDEADCVRVGLWVTK